MNVPHNRLDFLSTRGFKPLSTSLSPGKRCSRHTCSFIFDTLCSRTQVLQLLIVFRYHTTHVPALIVNPFPSDLSFDIRSLFLLHSSTNTYIHIWKHLLSDCSFENRRSSSIRRKDPPLNRPPTSLNNARVFCGSGQPAYRGHGAP